MNNLIKGYLISLLFIQLPILISSQDCTQDSIAPVIQCYTSTASVSLSAKLTRFAISPKDLTTQVQDNCASPEDVKLSFSADGKNPTLVVSCENLGLNQATIYATDPAGNQSSCLVNFLVQDGDFICGPEEDFELMGSFNYKDLGYTSPIPTFKISLTDSLGKISAIEPLEVYVRGFEFGINLFDGENPFPENSTISIELILEGDDAYSNGVSTLDVVFIVKHILGISPFTEPEQLVAADVNGDGKITSLDVIEIRKVIIGLSDSFSIGSSHVIFPKIWQIPVDQLLSTDHRSFDVIKLGDVNRF